MSKTADIGSKRLISLAPDTWVNWVTQQRNLTVRDFLSSDFQWVSRENDVLLRVTRPDLGEFLVLNEIQLRYSARMPQRMRAYAALAEERYNLPVYPVLINILPPSAAPDIPNAYRSQFLGIEAVQTYRVINLWEVEVDCVFRDRLSALLPFVPVLQGGNDAAIVQRAVRELRADERLQELEPLLAFFASFVLESPVIQDILRWDMAVLRESPWYREILQEGIDQGIDIGRNQGIDIGVERGQVRLLLQQLQQRFGELSAERRQQIESLSSQDIEELALALLEFDRPEDVEAWCDRRS